MSDNITRKALLAEGGHAPEKPMSPDTKKLHKRAMKFVGQARNLLKAKGLGRQWSDVDLIVTEPHPYAAGSSHEGQGIVYISANVLEETDDITVRYVIFHELVHAITGFEHDLQCPLMSLMFRRADREVTEQAFLRYFH